MADEGASSSSSIDEPQSEAQESKNSQSLNPSRSEGYNSSGIISGARQSQNPFAIKTTTPIRSIADSTEYKAESRPLVAPPTFILGAGKNHQGAPDRTGFLKTPILDSSHCTVSSSASSMGSRFTLRPSSLTAQTEKLKFVNNNNNQPQKSNDISSNQQEDKENKQVVDSSTNLHSESNGKGEPFKPTLSSVEPSSTLTSDKSTGGFIFGQNIHERAANYDEMGSSSSTELSFQGTVSQIEQGEQSTSSTAGNDKDEDPCSSSPQDKGKSLSESAKEYQSRRQVKRKFDEVAVVTGEEDESNVLQINCKLFTFNTDNGTYQERGRGNLRLNDREQDSVFTSRVVIRTQGSLRLILNAKVWPGMTVERPSIKTVRLTAIETDGIKVYLVQANPKDAEQLFNALDWRVATLKSRQGEEARQEASSTTTEVGDNKRPKIDDPDSSSSSLPPASEDSSNATCVDSSTNSTDN